MRSLRYLQFVDLALWVSAASGAVVGASLLLGFLIGRDLLTGKYILFGVGFLLFGLGSLMMQPTRPHERVQVEHGGGRGQSQGERGGGGGGATRQADDGDADGSRIDPEVDLSTLRKRAQVQRSRQHRYERKLQEVGPLADAHLPFDRRISRGTKIFLTGLVVLAVSFLMETAGVQV